MVGIGGVFFFLIVKGNFEKVVTKDSNEVKVLAILEDPRLYLDFSR